MADNTTAAPADQAKPGYAFNIIADVGSGIQVQITGSLPVGATREQIDAELQKFRKPLEKQRTLSVIPGIKEGIATAERTIAGYEAQLAKLDDARGVKPVPSNERGARDQMLANIATDTALVAHKKQLLAECEKEVME